MAVRQKPWGVKAVVAGVLMVLTIAIGGCQGGVQSNGTRQLHSVEGLTSLFDQARQQFGDTKGYLLLVYPDYASMDRADPNEERRKISYVYRGSWEKSSTGRKGSSDVLADLSAFDAKAVVDAIHSAPAKLDIKSSDVQNTYLIVRPASGSTGSLGLSVYVSADYGTGYIELDSAGKVKQVHQP